MAVASFAQAAIIVALARRATLIREEERLCTLVKVDNRVNELVKSPAFREEMRQKAQQRLENERDRAFRGMNRDAYLHATRMWAGGHRFLHEWREQASSELQQLRETERLRRAKKTAEAEEPFVAARIQLTCEITSAGAIHVSHMTGELVEDKARHEYDVSKILPITTPDEFARGFKVPPVIPGKRYSCCEMPRIRCKAEHYHWLKDCVRLGPVKSSRHDNQEPGQKLPSWARLGNLMWADGVAARLFGTKDQD